MRFSMTTHAVAISALLCTGFGCEERPPEPPAPVHDSRTPRNLEPVMIDVRTRLREIKIEVERLEELREDAETTAMVDSHPELLDDLDATIASTREMLRQDESRQSRRFQRFRADAEEYLDEYERRAEALRKEKPASGDAGSSK